MRHEGGCCFRKALADHCGASVCAAFGPLLLSQAAGMVPGNPGLVPCLLLVWQKPLGLVAAAAFGFAIACTRFLSMARRTRAKPV